MKYKKNYVFFSISNKKIWWCRLMKKFIVQRKPGKITKVHFFIKFLTNTKMSTLMERKLWRKIFFFLSRIFYVKKKCKFCGFYFFLDCHSAGFCCLDWQRPNFWSHTVYIFVKIGTAVWPVQSVVSL